MESEKSKKKKKNVKCALCLKHLREVSKSSHACSAHGNLVLFECGYCQRKFHGISRLTVRRHIYALHKNPNGRVDLNNFMDYRHLWQKEIKELRKKCFPVTRKREQEEAEESDEPFHVSRPELQCDLCNMILSNRCSVTNHACSHANLVIYQCEHCPRKFNGHDDRTSVRKHIRNHHKMNGQLVLETDYKDNRKKLANEIQLWKKKCFPRFFN